MAQKTKFDISLIFSLGIVGFFILLIATFIIFKINSQCANSISCIKNLSGQKETVNKGTFMGKTVFAPNMLEKPQEQQNTMVLGEQTSDYKHIYIDLTNQRLYAFEGTNKVMDFPVSTGKFYLTPTGDFRIWIWLRYTRMSGGSGAGYYNLPNVPYTMYFYNNSIPKYRGYGIHGAYWHNNFGHPMSHGCVNMRIEDVEKLYYWSNPNAGNISYANELSPGTLITIYGQTPSK